MKAEEIKELIEKTYNPDVEVYIRKFEEFGGDYEELGEIFERLSDEREKTESPFGLIIKFKNGYGASIIRTPFSYGKGLEVEIAVLQYSGDDIRKDFELTYDTDITDDVIGYLKEDRILEILDEIYNLGE